MNQYNEEFFEDKSLAVVYVPLSDYTKELKCESYEIKENTISIKYRINTIENVAGGQAVHGSAIIVEVEKNITQIV